MSTADLSTQSLPPATAFPARFTPAQFDQLIEVGFFADKPNTKVQLYRGEIQYMTPPNPPHDDVVTVAIDWAYENRANAKIRYSIRCQCSMDFIDQSSVLLPDVVLVADQPYASQRPSVADTRLLIEVADSSLSHDLNGKRDLHAEAGVLEYWVVDIPHRCLVVHRNLDKDRYRSVEMFDEQQTVRPKQIPQIELKVATLFR